VSPVCRKRHFLHFPTFLFWYTFSWCITLAGMLNINVSVNVKIQDTQLSLLWADRIAYIWRSASDFQSRKENDFPEWVLSRIRHGGVAISNATVYANMYNTVIWRTSVISRRQQLCIKNCGQTAANKDMVTVNSL